MSVRVLVVALVVQLALAVAFVIMAINGFPALGGLLGNDASTTSTGRIQTVPASGGAASSRTKLGDGRTR